MTVSAKFQMRDLYHLFPRLREHGKRRGRKGLRVREQGKVLEEAILWA